MRLRSIMAVLTALGFLTPLGASRAAQPPAADGKLLSLQRQAAETCAVASNKANGECDSMMALIIAYQKTVAREARADRQLSRDARQTALEARQLRLVESQRDIAAAKQEAADRANAAADSSARGAINSPCGPPSSDCAGKLKPVGTVREAVCSAGIVAAGQGQVCRPIVSDK